MAPTGIFAPISREGALVLNNILLCSICAVVLTGTTYPLFADCCSAPSSASGRRISTRRCCRWRCRCSLAMSLGPVLPWKRAELWPALLKLWWAALVAAAVGIVAAVGPARRDGRRWASPRRPG